MIPCATSNTPECFRTFVGQKVVGILIDALPVNRADLNRGTKTLVFEDGRGLTIASNGSYWVERPEEVRRAIAATQRKLEDVQRDLAGTIELAGVAHGA